ncbi:MAG TPA: hypothetical protein DDW30_08185 [Clostridiales bacterium]|nr:hypothetical protein [Clostridiales bacterium]
MIRKRKIACRIGIFFLLGALLLGGCATGNEPTVGTTETRPRAYTEGPPESTEAGTDSGRVTEETTTGGGKQEELPTVDIEKSNAKQKYFVGTTDKDAVSYKVGEEMKFTVSLRADGALASCAKFKYILKADDGRQPEEGYADGKTGVFTLTTKLDVPGFVNLQVIACNKDGNELSGVNYFKGGAGAEIEKLQKAKAEPADFDAFWQSQLAKLEGTAPDLLEAKEVESPNAAFTVYAVKIRFCAENTWGDYVSAYLSVPKNAKAGALGLHVNYNGAGVGDLTKECRSGKVTLNVAAHSMELNKPSWYYTNLANGKLKRYGFNEEYNATRETVYFREMILRDIQGMRFLKLYFGENGPDERFKGLWTEKKTLTVSGGSQGGFQSAAVAALEPGVTLMTLYCPWLCDIGGCGADGRQASTYMPAYTAALEYYDSVNFAKRLSCDIYIDSAGMGDYIATPSGVMAFYNSIGPNVTKRITFKQNTTHAGSSGNPKTYMLMHKAEKN